MFILDTDILTLLFAFCGRLGTDSAADEAAGFAVHVGLRSHGRSGQQPLAGTWIVLSRQRGFGVDCALNVVRRPES
jgi:hypothetical protein